MNEKRKEKARELINQPIYHRGNHTCFNEENTLASYKSALSKNKGVEVDLVSTKDKKIILFHDQNLKRVFGIDKKVNKFDFEQLKKFDHDFVLLDDFLMQASKEFTIMLEVKERKKDILKIISRILSKYKNYENIVIVSFDPKVLWFFSKNNPYFIRGQIASYDKLSFETNFIHKFLLRRLLLNFISKPDFISYDINSYKRKILVKRVIKKGYPLIGWTLTKKSRKKQLDEIFDSYIFEKMNI